MAHTNHHSDYSLYNSMRYSHRVCSFVPFEAPSMSKMLLNAVFLPELAGDFLIALVFRFRLEVISVDKDAGATRMAAPFDRG
jgi:hypothetical protein